ncbi:hypothetical protein [Avibacterium paragallinarum]|nr:hypothetical protein [Avibacterium paragallinarum]
MAFIFAKQKAIFLYLNTNITIFENDLDINKGECVLKGVASPD